MDIKWLNRNARIGAATRLRIMRSGFTANGHKVWSENEKELIRLYAPDYDALAKLLPHRTKTAIRDQTSTMGLARKKHVYTGAEIAKLRAMFPRASWPELLAAFPHANEESLRKIANRYGFRRARKPYKPTGHVAIDEIRAKCFEIRWTMRDLDAAAGTKRFFRGKAWKNQKSLPYKPVGKAVRALGGRLEIDWGDGEPSPQ